MKMNHTVAHYTLAALLAGGLFAVHAEKPKVQLVPTSETKVVTNVRTSRFDWPALGEMRTIALGESLAAIDPDKVHKVTLLCSAMSCQNFRTDLDDALQIAFWQSDFEDRFVDSEAEEGIFVGPPGPMASTVARSIEAATGAKVSIVGLTDIKGEIGIIIGKYSGD